MYNAAKYIERCVESVYHQGLNINDFEVLLINDGSTDNTSEVVKTFILICQYLTKVMADRVAQETLVLRSLLVTTLCLLTLMII